MIVAALLFVWQLQQHRRQARELACVQAQIQTKAQEIEARRAELAALEQRNGELVEDERRAGNQTLISLMRERAAAAAARSAPEAASDSHGVGSALANVLDSPDQQQVDREAIRADMKANMGLFFKLVRLPPEKIDQYIDLRIEKDFRQAKRMSALLRGELALADALRQRDSDALELESQQRALLGPEGAAFLDSIAEGMRNDEAKRLLNAVRQNMGANELTQEQSDRLQGLIKTEIVGIHMDDTDLFRSPEDWAQFFGEHQQNILNEAAGFLAPPQLETLKTLAALDLAERQKQMMLKRTSLGIK